MHNVIQRVQSHGAPEGDQHAPIDHAEFHQLCAKWRQAWARLREITWKRAELKAENYKHSDLTAARIEQSIADDVEFLKAHPTRRKDLQQ
jgi:hypothetical protein